MPSKKKKRRNSYRFIIATPILVVFLHYGCTGAGGASANLNLPQEGVVYFLDDHLGNAQLVTDSLGNVMHEESRYPYGLERSSEGEEAKPHYSYTGKEYDEETGLVYFGRRYYAPELGRWITPDPLVLSEIKPTKIKPPTDKDAPINSLEAFGNLYGYVRNNPMTRTDPSGLTSISFLREDGSLLVDPEIEGRPPYKIAATSGQDSCMNNPSCERVADVGPIPKGNYTGSSSELSDRGFMGDLIRNFSGDWGDWRMSLAPLDKTNTYGREGFFLHGGSITGTKGCIDIGGGIFGNKQTDTLRNDILQDPDGKIPLSVE